MKSKIRFIIVACFIAGVAVTGFNMAQENSNMDVSLADIAVMAMANEEGAPYCHAGGPGSNQCSIDAGITIAGYGISGGCSVTCDPGYYACCTLRCTCIET